MTDRKPNTVTKDDLDHLVAQSKVDYAVFDNKLTVAVITLPCGFKVTGESSCVDPANYNKELGEKYALDKATEKLWELEGYLLAHDLFRSNPPNDYFARLVFERAELNDRFDKLSNFLSKPKPGFVVDDQWALMKEQHSHMSAYLDVLNARIDATPVGD